MALSVTRKVQEAVWIGPICIRIIELDRGRANLSISCPAEYEVLREELAPKRPGVPGKFEHQVPRERIVQVDEGTAELVTMAKQQG